MTLSDHDLSQLNTNDLDNMPEVELRSLSKQLLVDLKQARERLKQSPDTSSRPPSSREPWKASTPRDESPDLEPAIEAMPTLDSSTPEADGLPNADSAASSAEAGAEDRPKKAGRPVGSQGYSRHVTLAVTQTISHAPACCRDCGRPFSEDTDYRLWGARYELELETGSEEAPKLQIEHRRHEYLVLSHYCFVGW